MKKIILSVLVLSSVFALVSCKMKSDVLVKFEGGQITRGQFYDWMKTRNMTSEPILKNKAQQKMKLTQMAVDEITYIEAKKDGYDKTEEFREIADLAKRNFIAGFLRKKVREESSFKENAVRVSIIKLMVKNYKIDAGKRINLTNAEFEKELETKMKDAKNIVKELDSGKSFSDMAKNYSDDASKKSGGEIGFVTKDTKGPEIVNAAMTLQEGQYTREPLRIGNNLYLVKLMEKKELNEKNIDKIIKDETQRNQLKNALSVSYAREFEAGLTNQKDVEFKPNAVDSGNPAALLFSVGEKKYTLGNLNRLIDLISKKTQAQSGRVQKFDTNFKKDLAQRLLTEEVLNREAVRRGLDKDAKFAKDWEVYQFNTVIGGYRNDRIFSGVTVSQQDVRNEYFKNKDRYSEQQNAGGKQIKREIPFEKVKERIEMTLVNTKRMNRKKDWETEMLNKYKFEIIEKDLEGK